jgi:hypothetical protein
MKGETDGGQAVTTFCATPVKSPGFDSFQSNLRTQTSHLISDTCAHLAWNKLRLSPVNTSAFRRKKLIRGSCSSSSLENRELTYGLRDQLPFRGRSTTIFLMIIKFRTVRGPESVGATCNTRLLLMSRTRDAFTVLCLGACLYLFTLSATDWMAGVCSW